MRVALVHDYLNQYGGAERVLEALMALFPEAPIYTLVYDKEKTFGRFEGRVRRTSFLDFQWGRHHHRAFIPLMPFAARSLRLGGEYDLIISDTAGYAKGISYDQKKTRHLSYCHTPLRYAWETDQYVRIKYPTPEKNGIVRLLTFPVASYLRRWDFRTAQRPDMMLANSQFIADKIRSYYKREAPVIYPPVDTSKFYFEHLTKNSQLKTNNYYLAVGRLVHYKRFDLLIETFAGYPTTLKIVGDGPEKERLVRLAQERRANVEFIPPPENDEALRVLYQNARALLFPQVEDFGLVAAEAQSCGTPVIAFNAGGAREIVISGETGMLFGEQSPRSLRQAIGEFEHLSFDRRAVNDAAKRFSIDIFNKNILSAAERVLAESALVA